MKKKEINENNELMFEGEYVDDQIWNGKGKELNVFNELIFEGEYLNAKDGMEKEKNLMEIN